MSIWLLLIFALLLLWITSPWIHTTARKYLKISRPSDLLNQARLDRLMPAHEQENGGDEDQKIRLFRNALDFSKVKLRDCMIPRTDMVAIEVTASLEELKQKFIETGFSRIPVFDDQIDHIIGYVRHSDLFTHPADIRSMIRPIHIVPETMPANRLLSQMLSRKLSVTVVVDEFGGTAGLVTTEDILEKIFGDIEDEHDYAGYVEKKISETEYRFSGRLDIDYLNSTYQLNLPFSEEYETLAGLILYHHASIPKVNEAIRIGNFFFRILKGTETRIELVELKL